MINKGATFIYLFSYGCLFFLLSGCTIQNDTDYTSSLVVFAGSACQPVLKEIARNYELQSNVRIELVFGGSGMMLSWMKLTGKGDIYMPGSSDFMIKAERENLVDSDSICIAAYLVPAINVKPGNPKDIHSLSDLKRKSLRIGIARPEHVCVGLYAVELLEANGLLASVVPNLVVTTESCAKTASALVLSDLDAVIGWREFQYWDPDHIESVLVKEEKVPRLGTIPIAVTSLTRQPLSAKKFVEFVCSRQGKAVFEKWGYITQESKVRELAPFAEIGGEYTLPPNWMSGNTQ